MNCFRVQLSRKKGFRLPPDTVVVARPSKWGNPFKVTPQLLEMMGSKEAAQQAVVTSFEDWLNGSDEGKLLKQAAQKELRGKNLACWCKIGSPCHADTLIKIANSKIQ